MFKVALTGILSIILLMSGMVAIFLAYIVLGAMG